MTNYFEVDKVITCAGTAPIASTAVDIYAIKAGKDPLLMKRQLAVTAGAWTTTMTVPKTYVSPFGEVYLKVVDSYNPTIAGTKFYTIDPTLTITTPVLTGGASGTVSGTSNHVGQKVEVELRLAGQDPEDSWTPFGQATVAENGTWAATNAAPAAGTYDFRVIDENIDPAVCSAQVDDVVVASGSFIPDGSELYIVQTSYMHKIPLGIDYDLTGIDSGDITASKSLGAAYGIDSGFAFSPDGKKIIGIRSVYATSSIFGFTLSTGWDISTINTTPTIKDISAVMTGAGTATSLQVSPNGKYVFLFSNADSKFFRFDMSIGWDISTLDTTPAKTLITTGNRSYAISPDGAFIYRQDSVNNRWRVASVAIPYDIESTITNLSYVSLTGLYNFAQITFSENKRTVYFLCATSAAKPTLMKYITGLSADYDFTGKVIGDVVSVSNTLDSNAFAFGR